jgi:hypothetical protein
MDRPTQNKRAARRIVEESAKYWQPDDGTETGASVDDEHGYYQVVNSGWLKGQFVHFCFMHLIVKPDEKIYLRKNDAEWEIADALRQTGAASEDIVLESLRPPATVEL